MSNPYGEPRNGDFVAYIHEIEKRQLAAMSRPQAPVTPAQAMAAGGTPPKGERKALTADEAKQLVEKLRASGHGFSAFDVMRLVFGFIVLMIGLAADGGLIALAIAVALLWGPIRRIAQLIRSAGEAARAPRQSVDAIFGRNAPRTGAKTSKNG